MVIRQSVAVTGLDKAVGEHSNKKLTDCFASLAMITY